MTKFLQSVLEANEPLFSLGIRQLEQLSGNHGIDIRYTLSIRDRARTRIAEIGLDPNDLSARELYNALKNADKPEDASDLVLYFDDVLVSLNPDDVKESGQKQLPNNITRNARQAILNRLIDAYSETISKPKVIKILKEAGVKNMQDNNTTDTTSQQTNAPLVLCVGDIISDAFIKLNDEHTGVFTDDQGYTRITMELGGKLPYDEVELVDAVECSPNAAVSLSRLGLRASLMSWIGDDQVGQDMIKYLTEQGVGTDYMVVEPGMKSNYHYVLRYGADRVKLQKFEDYSYEWRDPKETPDWLYLGVLGEKTWPLHEAMMDYLERNPSVKLVFQPGMYHLMWGAEKLKKFYEHADIVIMNREEAAQVTGRERADVKQLIAGLHELGVTVAVVTDGPEGAYASKGEGILFMENYPDPKPPLDRTGAGDAFASTLSGALALGESLETALEWAPINSMSVVQQMGAQAGLLKLPELKGYLEKAPETYKPTSFE